MAIGKEGGIDKQDEYEVIAKVKCNICNLVFDNINPLVQPVVDFILASHSAADASKIAEWEREYKPCEHVLTLMQDPMPTWQPINPAKIKCDECDLTSNLWFCLTCGHMGCGRSSFDGSGGNAHGVEHEKATKHPVVVKMGTITPEGKACILSSNHLALFCYACDDDVIDPSLSQHMEVFGIDVKKQVKTEKTMAELDLALNLSFSLSQKYEEGLKLTFVYGPCLTGIENVGNTCYIASVLQVLFSLPEFMKRYFEGYEKHMDECLNFPPDCFMCQICKMGFGLCSGIYSQPKKHKKILYKGQSEEEKDKDYFYQDGINPQMFKAYFGKGHPDYSTGQQQDAALYFTYLLDKIQRQEKFLGNNDPGRIFQFEIECKLKCLTCGGVKYKKQTYSSLKLFLNLPEEVIPENTIVNIIESLDDYIKGDTVPIHCGKCGKVSTFSKSNSFLNFPKVLLLVMQREVMEGMMLKKLPVLFDVPIEELDVQKYKVQPHDPNEVLLEGNLCLLLPR